MDSLKRGRLLDVLFSLRGIPSESCLALQVGGKRAVTPLRADKRADKLHSLKKNLSELCESPRPQQVWSFQTRVAVCCCASCVHAESIPDGKNLHICCLCHATGPLPWSGFLGVWPSEMSGLF